jgi:hypothetical protein
VRPRPATGQQPVLDEHGVVGLHLDRRVGGVERHDDAQRPFEHDGQQLPDEGVTVQDQHRRA